MFSTGSGSPQTVDVLNVKTDKFFEVSAQQQSGKNIVNDVTGQHSTGIGGVVAPSADMPRRTDVYTIDGRLVRSLGVGVSQKQAVSGLAPGLYIVGGKKVVVR